MSTREFTVVMRGPSAAIFREGEALILKSPTAPGTQGPVAIRYSTRWLKHPEAGSIPGHLWIEVKGVTSDLEGAIESLANAGMVGLGVIATSGNATVGEPLVELAFDSSPKAIERDYFQSYVSPEPAVVYSGRLIDTQATLALFAALESSGEDKPRLTRAIVHYNFALTHWKEGHATMAVEHLWIAIEALTPIAERRECAARNLSTREELASYFQLSDVKALAPYVRKEILLRGDEACYRLAKDVNDGLEHGFREFGLLLQHSREVRLRLAKFVRMAIFELAGLPPETSTFLLSDRFAAPLGHWPVQKNLRGSLRSGSASLSAAGSQYPLFRWETRIKGFEIDEVGKMKFTLDDTLTPLLGDQVTLSITSIEHVQLT